MNLIYIIRWRAIASYNNFDNAKEISDLVIKYLVERSLATVNVKLFWLQHE